MGETLQSLVGNVMIIFGSRTTRRMIASRIARLVTMRVNIAIMSHGLGDDIIDAFGHADGFASEESCECHKSCRS